MEPFLIEFEINFICFWKVSLSFGLKTNFPSNVGVNFIPITAHVALKDLRLEAPAKRARIFTSFGRKQGVSASHARNKSRTYREKSISESDMTNEEVNKSATQNFIHGRRGPSSAVAGVSCATRSRGILLPKTQSTTYPSSQGQWSEWR